MGNGLDRLPNYHASKTLKNGRYRLVKELGKGSFTVAYEALDLQAKGKTKRVVVKILWNDLPVYEEYFERESKFHELHGGYIEVPVRTATFLDRFYDEQIQSNCFVQEYIEGELLDSLASELPFSEEKALVFLHHFLQYLKFLHGKGILHRDIKPENIMQDVNGSYWLIDFGVCSLPEENSLFHIFTNPSNTSSEAANAVISREKTTIGTLGYMAPETFTGECCPASDLFALGWTAVYLLRGGENSPYLLPNDAMVEQLINANLVQVHSPSLKRILIKMLKRKVEARYKSSEEILQELVLVGESKDREDELQQRKLHVAGCEVEGLNDFGVCTLVLSSLLVDNSDVEEYVTHVHGSLGKDEINPNGASWRQNTLFCF